MHVEPQWANKHLLLLLINNKQGESKMTPHLAALVKRVAELHDADLRACHCVKEITLRRICPLDYWEKLAYECPWPADLSHEPATGKIFNFTYCC
jgi:hypothetical protein